MTKSHKDTSRLLVTWAADRSER